MHGSVQGAVVNRAVVLARTDRQTHAFMHKARAHSHTHTLTRTCTYPHTHMRIHTRTCTCAYTHAHMHMRVHVRLVVLHADVCERDEEEHPASDCKAQPLQLQTHLLHQGSIAAKRFKCGAPTCCVGVTQSTHRFWMLNAGCKSLLAFQPISNRTWTSLTANMTEVCSTSPPPIICSRWDHAFLLILIS